MRTPEQQAEYGRIAAHEARALAILAGRDAGFVPDDAPVLVDLEAAMLVDRTMRLTTRGHRALRCYRRDNGLGRHK